MDVSLLLATNCTPFVIRGEQEEHKNGKIFSQYNSIFSTKMKKGKSLTFDRLKFLHFYFLDILGRNAEIELFFHTPLFIFGAHFMVVQ